MKKFIQFKSLLRSHVYKQAIKTAGLIDTQTVTKTYNMMIIILCVLLRSQALNRSKLPLCC